MSKIVSICVIICRFEQIELELNGNEWTIFHIYGQNYKMASIINRYFCHVFFRTL